MARTKKKAWLEKGRANRLASKPDTGKKPTGQPLQQQSQEPPKKKQKATPKSASAPATSPDTDADSFATAGPPIAATPPPPPPPPPPQQQQQQQQTQQQHQEPTIPFDPNERILLVGEGDYSFAHSIVEHHGCADVLATSLDARDELDRKYPQAAAHMAYLEGEGQRVAHGVDATKLGANKEVKKGPLSGGLVDEGGSPREKGKWDRIIFNFPHVGGKSTDVNRQVRYNQELLVSFFTAALPLLSTAHNPDSPISPAATIIITLFEAEPYTLWNVRDLARHVGLRVQRSFRFRADAYPGYRHARTLGNVEGANGGAWRGEERSARTYVFEAGDNGNDNAPRGCGGNKGKKKDAAGAGGKKRKKGGKGSESDDE